MAKKTRRARRQASKAVQPVRITRPSRPVAAQTGSKEVDFATEYHYVIEDLRRIAITAGGLMVLLVVLAVLLS
jgi:hypothetical protein